MQSDSDDEGVVWLERVEHPKTAEHKGVRSLIFSCLGDEKAGKSTLLSRLGFHDIRKVPLEKDKMFRLQMSNLDKSQIRKFLNTKEKAKLEGILLIEPLHNGKIIDLDRIINLSDIVIVVVDSSSTTCCINDTMKVIKDTRKPFILVFNKTDLVEEPEDLIQLAEQLKKEGIHRMINASNIVFLSAVNGDGVLELIDVLCDMAESLNQNHFTLGNTKCEVFGVKDTQFHGIMLLVVVVDGVLHVGDTVVVKGCDPQEAITMEVKALWTPIKSGYILKEEGPYADEKEVHAGHAVLVELKKSKKEKPAGECPEPPDERPEPPVGDRLYVLGPDDDILDLKRRAIDDYYCSYEQMLRRLVVK